MSGDPTPLTLLLALTLGYLCGSIPFGLLLTRGAGTTDIRTIGSGNIGATNVLRTGRKDLAAATLLLDGLKGTLAVLLAGAFWGGDAALAAACGAFLGHIFPVWLRFAGGKGVATFLGCALGVFWPAGLAFMAAWLLVAAATRYSSASALVASLVAPGVLAATGQGRAALVFLVMAVVLWITHRANIARLLAGQEGNGVGDVVDLGRLRSRRGRLRTGRVGVLRTSGQRERAARGDQYRAAPPARPRSTVLASSYHVVSSFCIGPSSVVFRR